MVLTILDGDEGKATGISLDMGIRLTADHVWRTLAEMQRSLSIRPERNATTALGDRI